MPNSKIKGKLQLDLLGRKNYLLAGPQMRILPRDGDK